MLTEFLKGGFMMYPLLLCSILSVAIIINRFWVYYRLSKDEKRMLPVLNAHIKKGGFAEASQFLSTVDSPLARIIRAGLENRQTGDKEMMNAMERQELIEMSFLEKYLPALSTIGSISTLLGFTGTVTGMINAFNAIAAAGVSSPTIVASGIAEALITTAYGLFIAIPTVVAHQYFGSRLDKLTLEIEKYKRVI